MSSVPKRFVSGFLLAVSLAVCASAQSSLVDVQNKLPAIDTTERIVEQVLATKKDVDDFLRDINAALSAGEPSAAIMLGDYYIYDKHLKDGYIGRDEEKSEYYYNLAGERGMALGYYKLADVALVNKDYSKTLFYLDSAMGAPLCDPLLKSAIASKYATVTLEYFPDHVGLLQKSATFLSENTNSVSTAEFILANIYNKLGLEEGATYYLTKACTNPNITEGIQSQCMGKRGIELSVNGKTVAGGQSEKNTSSCCAQ